MDDNNYVDFEEAKPEKKNNKTIIIIAVVAVVLCCCCVVGGYALWTYGDQLVQGLNLGY
jgi:flagellar basal body-associated protein FliL